MKIEYRVRPVTRYQVTRYHEEDNGAGCKGCGEFDNEQQASDVMLALAEKESRSNYDLSLLTGDGFAVLRDGARRPYSGSVIGGCATNISSAASGKPISVSDDDPIFGIGGIGEGATKTGG